MKIETYLNGELVGESEIDLPIRPNISGFITQMFFSDSYIKIKNNLQNKDQVTTLELLAVRLELKPIITRADLEVIKLLWDGIIENSPEILLEIDRNNFQQICESNFMPFTFDDNFKLEILLSE
jgi:hypothetical protein